MASAMVEEAEAELMDFRQSPDCSGTRSASPLHRFAVSLPR